MKPTEEQIQETIQIIREKLSSADATAKASVVEGYSEAVAILAEGRETYDGIERLDSIQGRAIAMLAVDYLNGEETQKMLCGVPI